MDKFYKVGGSLAFNSPSYVKRPTDDELFDSLYAGELCYILNARQMGKSSLKVRTMDRLRQYGYLCTAIDISEIGTVEIFLEEWYASIVYTLLSDFNLLDRFDLDKWWKVQTRQQADLGFAKRGASALIGPAKRLSSFLGELLRLLPSKKIVIFFDEIDSILNLKLDVQDFFSVIRSCYEKRADNLEFNRLIFCFIGVASPSDFIKDQNRAPFNIGKAINLSGLKFPQASALLPGLRESSENPECLLKIVLSWTGGQPFLTQKVCALIQQSSSFVNMGQEAEFVSKILEEKIFNNWEHQDQPEHLKTTRNRIFGSQKFKAEELLRLYQRVLRQEEVVSDNSEEQLELRLSGLVADRMGKLQVMNPIVKRIFDMDWVDDMISSTESLALKQTLRSEVNRANLVFDLEPTKPTWNRSSASRKVSQALLKIQYANSRENISLVEFSYLIGRDDRCNIRLNSKNVSRIHASIKKVPVGANVYELVDERSMNGTLVNGFRINRHTLQHGDKIYFADVQALFLYTS